MTEFVALRAKMYAYRKIDRLVAQHEHFVAYDEKCCKGTKSVWFLKALCLMTIRSACLMVKQYITEPAKPEGQGTMTSPLFFKAKKKINNNNRNKLKIHNLTP